MRYSLLKYRNFNISEDSPSQDLFYFHSRLIDDSNKDDIDPFHIKKVIMVVPKKRG